MVKYCGEHRGQVQCLVVYAVNRFARNAADHLTVRASLAAMGIRLCSVTEPLDDTSEGKLLEGIFTVLSEFDNAKRSDRTTAGMKARLERGGWPFPVPPGYRKVAHQGVVQDPEQAPLVRTAFELYATGQFTKREVLDRVTAAGLRTPKGKVMASQTFDRLLANPIYAGSLVVAAWGVNVRGAFEPIVTPELFEIVQARLEGRRPTVTPHKRFHPDFPLRHFVRCGACDRPLTASWSRGRNAKYPYYFCQAADCKAVSERKEKLE
jgi:hypothetical protein